MTDTNCSLCIETCILPYHNTCIHGSKISNGCYSCVNKWYKFNKKNKYAISWNGCGCKFDLSKPFFELLQLKLVTLN